MQGREESTLFGVTVKGLMHWSISLDSVFRMQGMYIIMISFMRLLSSLPPLFSCILRNPLRNLFFSSLFLKDHRDYKRREEKKPDGSSDDDGALTAPSLSRAICCFACICFLCLLLLLLQFISLSQTVSLPLLEVPLLMTIDHPTKDIKTVSWHGVSRTRR